MLPDLAEHYRQQLRPLFQGKKVVLATGVAAGCQGWLKLLRELGARRPLLLAESEGTGPVPGPEELEWLAVLERPARSVMECVRSYEKGLRSPRPEILEALCRYDPGREAVFVASQAVELAGIDGRPRLGAPKASWRAFEDKTAIDGLWDRIGVQRLPSRVLEAADAEGIKAAFRELDLGKGIVLAGDSRDGWHGGAERVRWCETEASLGEALAFFGAHCARVRAAPFLEGVPCSVHGIAFPGGEAAIFRPMEMIVLRRPAQPRLFYSGMATYWSPAPADREAMRSAARLAAEALRREAGYLGGFTIDGVMGAEGFFPTELNARAGAGLRTIALSVPGLPLEMVEIAARAGEPLDFRPADLEALVVGALDASPRGGGWATLERAFPKTSKHNLAENAGGSFRLAAPGERPDAQALTGPGPTGGFASYMPDPGRLPKGALLAERTAKVWALLDAEFGAGFGPLEAARDVRREALGS